MNEDKRTIQPPTPAITYNFSLTNCSNMSLSITRTVLNINLSNFPDEKVTLALPGVRGLSTPVGGCTCVHTPVIGASIDQVQDAGLDPTVAPELPDDEVAGVLQHHPAPRPLDQANWIRPETAGQTQIVTSGKYFIKNVQYTESCYI